MKLERDETAALRRTPLFSDVGEKPLEQLVAHCKRLELPKGAQVFAARSPADAFYAVLRGRIKIHKISAKGDEQILHLYGPGSTFGEAAVLVGKPFPAFADTLEKSVLLKIGRTVLLRTIREDPDLALGMLGGLSQKLQEFAHLIEDLSLREVPARLAGALLEMSDAVAQPTFDLPVAKRQLAARLGTVAETLSRGFNKLRKDGLIDVRGSRITIIDAAALHDVADNG